MLRPDLQEIKYYIVKNGKPLDDRIFDEYYDAEKELNNLQLLDEEAYAELSISSYTVRNRIQLNG